MSIAKPVHGIDCHAHVFSADAPAVANARYRPAYEARLEDWMAQWPIAGIARGVLVQPSFFGTDNGELVAAVEGDVPERQLLALDGAGVRGIRLNLRGVADFGLFAREPWPLLFARVAALGWHVETFFDAGRAVDLAAALAGTTVDVVFDHFANPAAGAAADATFDALAALSRDRTVWLKLSGAYRLQQHDAASLARRWIDVLGPDHIVWGSDWPWTQHEDAQDYVRLRRELDDWIGAERARAALWDNAARLYRFD